MGMSVPRMNYYGKSDRGLKRSNNEDAFVIAPELGLCAVADGMGGAAAGEMASLIFTESALSVFSKTKHQSEQERLEAVKQAFSFAHERIRDHVGDSPQHEGMGCTAELAVFYNESCLVGHIGDSRTYLFRDGRLKQLTRDHSLVQDQIDSGFITASEAGNHPLRNVIFRAVGVNEGLEVDLLKGRVLPGDVYLLSSDGLTDMVSDSSIKQVLSSSIGLPQKVERLIELAISAGGYDNITVILCECAAL